MGVRHILQTTFACSLSLSNRLREMIPRLRGSKASRATGLIGYEKGPQMVCAQPHQALHKLITAQGDPGVWV